MPEGPPPPHRAHGVRRAGEGYSAAAHAQHRSRIGPGSPQDVHAARRSPRRSGPPPAVSHHRDLPQTHPRPAWREPGSPWPIFHLELEINVQTV